MRVTTYKNFLLTLLMLILACSWMERFALILVLQEIKVELGLSDTQLGLLTGIAFALFYSVMGIPIARWADRGDRVMIITLTMSLWSAAVALCGMAGSFLQLLLVRIGVAVGEAGCIAPASSLISHYFSRTERPRALSRYMLGLPLSALVGYFVAGWLNQYFGWRTMFLILAVPGVCLAAVAWLSLREPRRVGTAVEAGRESNSSSDTAPGLRESSSAQPSMKEVCVTLWANTTFRHLLFYWSVLAFFSFGMSKWKPAFFIRSHGLETGEVGTWFGLIYGLGGLLGTFLGGELASRYAANNERLQLRWLTMAYCAFGILSAGIYLSTNRYLAFGLLAVVSVGLYSVTGPLYALVQTLVPERMRATSIALLLLFANLIGGGLGPLAAGALSDAFRPWADEESLRYALLALCPGYFWAAWHLFAGSRTVTRDMEAAHSASQRAAS